MDVTIQFGAVDQGGALKSASSNKLEGVRWVIALGARAWMFSSENLNETVQVAVSAWARDREEHEALSVQEDAAWQKVSKAVEEYAAAFLAAQAERLKYVEIEEGRARAAAEKAEKQTLERFVKPKYAGKSPEDVESTLIEEGLVEPVADPNSPLGEDDGVTEDWTDADEDNEIENQVAAQAHAQDLKESEIPPAKPARKRKK
jgi:hypothetical protein